ARQSGYAGEPSQRQPARSRRAKLIAFQSFGYRARSSGRIGIRGGPRRFLWIDWDRDFQPRPIVPQDTDFIGGPGGTRTPNQTVMSGGRVILPHENQRFS